MDHGYGLVFIFVRVASRNRILGTVCRFSSFRVFRLTQVSFIRVASLNRIRASSAKKSLGERTLLAFVILRLV